MVKSTTFKPAPAKEINNRHIVITQADLKSFEPKSHEKPKTADKAKEALVRSKTYVLTSPTKDNMKRGSRMC
jgi:hypothetical protein